MQVEKKKIYNLYCFTCKRIVRSDSETCPECKEKGKIVGVVTNIGTSNGRYPMHT